MADDRSEDEAPAEPGRPKRDPPTIHPKATDVSESPKPETREAEHAAAEPAPAPEAAAQPSQPVSKPVSPWAIAPISGAVAAALVVAVGWVLGCPAVEAPSPAPQLNAAAIDDLTTRIAGLEAKTSKPAGDPAAAVRM